MNVIDRVRRLVPPPSSPVAAGSLIAFHQVESTLGLALPEDYKLLVTMYGDGQWQEFWYLLNPFSPNPHLNLLQQAPRDDVSGNNLLSAERYIRNRHPEYPHKIWPEESGIFPWALTDNGGRFFWVIEGPPEEWASIYYPSRDPDHQELGLSTSEIVAGVLSGDLPLFQEEFGGETAEPFTPLNP